MAYRYRLTPLAVSDIDDVRIRHSVIGNYVLVFEVDEVGQLIKILRFLYGGMDIANININ